MSARDNRSRRIEAVARGMEARWLRDPKNRNTKAAWPEVHRKAYFDTQARLALEDADAAGPLVDPPAAPDCTHESASGITTYNGPEKVWRCDGCGWLHVNATDEQGITHSLDIEGALVAAMHRTSVDLQRIARSYLDSGNDWADRDTDEEAMEIRSARVFCRQILDPSSEAAFWAGGVVDPQRLYDALQDMVDELSSYEHFGPVEKRAFDQARAALAVYEQHQGATTREAT